MVNDVELLRNLLVVKMMHARLKSADGGVVKCKIAGKRQILLPGGKVDSIV